MEFRNRSDQSAPANRPSPSPTPAAAPVASPSHPMPAAAGHDDNKSVDWQAPGWLRFVYVLLLFSLTILCVAVAYFLSTYNPNESKYVLDDKYQAVFLSNGQVYFGKVKSINSHYIDLRNIFYLNSQSQTGQTSTNSNNNQFTLVKLGCELHQPFDQMLINHSGVTFWENIQDNSQVVKKIKEWQQQNPNGQTCSTTTSNTNQNTGSSSTNSSSNKQ